LSQRHFVILRIKPGSRISLLQEHTTGKREDLKKKLAARRDLAVSEKLVVINQNFRIWSCHRAETAKLPGRWPAAPDRGVNFPYSYSSNSGTYRKVHRAIARENRMDRKILFNILASRAQKHPETG
jgi:hypothetical protein